MPPFNAVSVIGSIPSWFASIGDHIGGLARLIVSGNVSATW